MKYLNNMSDNNDRLTSIETSIRNLTQEFVNIENRFIMSKAKEVTLLGAANDGEVTLAELEATVKVLKGYKETGFKNIRL